MFKTDAASQLLFETKTLTQNFIFSRRTVWHYFKIL